MMPDGDLADALVLAHRMAGYVTVFALAPLALAAFAQASRHRALAKAFLYAMVPLYLTGLFFTFARHGIGTFDWARNLAFNFFGFFFLLLGWRAIWRYRNSILSPGPLDHSMRATLLAVSAALVGLGIHRHFPSLVLGCLGLWLGLVVFREAAEARALYVRHQRCMLASYFYVLTVVSLVHVRASANLKWLWPTLLGVLIAAYATRGADARRRTVVAVRFTLAITLFLGAYVVLTSFALPTDTVLRPAG